MQMYPAYRLRDVMAEYAITFFALLNEGYRIKHLHYQMLAKVADLPYLKKEDRVKFYNLLEWASKHPADILSSSGEGSSPAEIKKALSGK